MAGGAIAAPASDTAKPLANAVQVKKTPQVRFLDGLACLKKSDTACAQLALAGIPSQSAYAKLLEGNIAVTQGDFDRAFRLLLPLQAEASLPAEANASLHASLALAYENEADTLRALEQRTLAENDLTSAEDVQANQQSIWQLLANLPKEQLVALRGESPDTVVQGWIDLGLAARANEPAKSVASWRKIYPDHPASATILEKITERSGKVDQTASGSSRVLSGPIALLLPFAVEAFAPAADAIQRGFAAAQTQANGDAEIRIYATTGNKDEIAAIYQKAVSDGAKYVLGPLTRDEVTALATGKLAVPTLALNEPDSVATAGNLYTFGLSVDAEAQQIAKIARDSGMQTALVVAGSSGLSNRMVKAFSDAWIAEGGQITAQVGMAENTDLATLKTLTAEHSADMLLLAANAEEARAIRPYLDIATPAFGFSHIYAGIRDEPLDAPLAALRFVDLPWLLEPNDADFAEYKSAAADLPQGESQRWFAVGVDAYQILLALSQHKATTIHGLTGKIDVSASGDITRQLALGRFSKSGLMLEQAP